MKIRRRTNKCLNCFRNIDEVYNFCPNCGQENTNRNVKFKDLIREFFSNYLSFDSKFGRSIKPFFLNPGKLTNEFVKGRRVNYANPIRLYLVLSLVFFFTLGKFNSYKNDDKSKGKVAINLPNKEGTDEKVEISDKEATEKLIEEAPDSTSMWPFGSKKNVRMFSRNLNDLTVTESQLYDSMDVSGFSTFDRLALKQVIRVSRSSSKEMMGYVIEQMPLLMFIMLPVFALLLKLLYIRREHNYIIHLVHSLHQHSFKFFMLALATVSGLFIANNKVSIFLVIGAFMISLLYVFLSFLNVYKQGFFKTFLKFCMYYFIYFFLLSIGLTIEMLLSLAFY